MDERIRYRGRVFTEREIEEIRELIALHPGKSTFFLSKELCRVWDWTQANGIPKDMVCRGLLLKLHALPDGAVQAFRVVSPDKLYAYVGRTQVKYIPVNETVELELGNDREDLVKPTLMNWVKTDIAFDGNGNVKGWTLKETWEIEVQNSKDIDVVLDIRRNFSGDWSMTTDAKYEKVEANKVKCLVPLRAREKQKFGYEVTTRLGTNATK